MDPLANPKVKSLGDMFFESVGKYASKTLYQSKRDGHYRGLTYREVGDMVKNLAMGPAALGIKQGDKVAIVSPSQEEWAMSDFAILSLGAATVPIYPNLPAKQVEYILQNSDSKIIFASDKDQLAKVASVKSNCPQLTHAVVFAEQYEKSAWTIGFRELQDKGKSFGASSPSFVSDAVKQVKLEDLATIIYTSGTTGLPKGVMLTHGNLISNCVAASKSFPIFSTDILLSFLPLSHIFERNPGHFLPVFNGSSIAYAESIEAVGQNLAEVHPTLMTAVPRLFEKLYGRIQDGLSAAPPIRRKIFAWALRVGHSARLSGKRGFSYAVANKLVYTKLRARLGGNIKAMLSGGAPLSKEIGEFFANLGITILEGYGLTETSPVITVNRMDFFKFGTVGCTLEGVEVKIAPDGEILTRGPHVMKGYYKNEAATKEVMDPDGWFHTGDIGFLDQDQYLTITDRKKNIIVTSGGKNVAPQPIENLLVTIPYVEQVMVIGDKRNFISALIVPNLEKLRTLAKENAIVYNSDDDLIVNKQIYALLDKQIQEVQENSGLARYEKVKKFALLPKAFSIESGELTPTLKIKRNVIIENFVQIIESLYNRETETTNESELT